MKVVGVGVFLCGLIVGLWELGVWKSWVKLNKGVDLLIFGDLDGVVFGMGVEKFSFGGVFFVGGDVDLVEFNLGELVDVDCFIVCLMMVFCFSIVEFFGWFLSMIFVVFFDFVEFRGGDCV